MALVVGRIIQPVLPEAFLELHPQGLEIPAPGIPVDEEWLDLGAQEVVGTGRAQVREPGPIHAVREAKGLRIVLDRGHEPLLRRDLPAQPGKDVAEQAAPLVVLERRDLQPAKRLLAPIASLDIRGGAVNDVQGGLVARLVVVVPRTHAVMAQNHTLRLRVLLDERLHPHADVEARPLPGDVEDVVAIDLPAEALLIHGSGHRDHRVGVKVIHVFMRHEGVERSVDGTGPRVQVEHAVAVHVVHVVLSRRLRAAWIREVERLHRPHPGRVERSKPIALRRPQVPA